MADFAVNPRPAPSMIDGSRGPEQINQTRVIADVHDEVFLYMPNASPLLTLSGRFRKTRTVTQSKYDWLTQDEYPRSVVVNTAAASGDTSVVLQAGHGARIAKFYTLLNPRTRETLYVTAVATDTLTVTRGIGSTAQAIVVGDTLIFTRPTYEDGSDLGTLKSIKEDNEFNYTEILRTPFGFTGRQLNTSLYGGKDPVLTRKVFGIEHSKSIEKMFYFGTRHLITGTHQTTFSGGLEFYIKSNVWDLNGSVPNERTWVEFLEEAMRWGMGGNLQSGGTKYLFHSARWGTHLEFFAKDKLQYRVLDKTIGLAAKEYLTTHGTVMLMHSPILDYYHPDYAFLVDLNHVRKVAHQGRDTKLLENRQGNGIDGRIEEYLSDVGLMVELEASHALLKGLPA